MGDNRKVQGFSNGGPLEKGAKEEDNENMLRILVLNFFLALLTSSCYVLPFEEEKGAAMDPQDLDEESTECSGSVFLKGYSEVEWKDIESGEELRFDESCLWAASQCKLKAILPAKITAKDGAFESEVIASSEKEFCPAVGETITCDYVFKADFMALRCQDVGPVGLFKIK